MAGIGIRNQTLGQAGLRIPTKDRQLYMTKDLINEWKLTEVSQVSQFKKIKEPLMTQT